jgi:hypothetical protein
VTARLKLWGGVPRHVLSHPEREWQDDLFRAADATDMKMLPYLTRIETLPEGQVSNHIFLMRTKSEDPAAMLSPDQPEFYSFWRMSFCSPAIAHRVLKRFVEFSRQEARHLAARMQAEPATSAVAGQLIEHIAVRDLCEGGVFDVRRIDESAVGGGLESEDSAADSELRVFDLEDMSDPSKACTLPKRFRVKVPPSSEHEFDDLASLQPASSKQLLRPRSKTQAGFDLALPGSLLVNISLNSAHHVLLSGIKNPGIIEAWTRLRQIYEPQSSVQVIEKVTHLSKVPPLRYVKAAHTLGCRSGSCLMAFSDRARAR